ncbi:hypothetical protein ElyMa_001774600 [Elysia marginata]|uniref:Secreted protein n=1 Tax=Elysia marginata TaxID=1093978 RepID=A0AAV4ED21_9GAST|nr:hypothetical protein ElyMa_001774600 [Elysia marginata]
MITKNKKRTRLLYCSCSCVAECPSVKDKCSYIRRDPAAIAVAVGQWRDPRQGKECSDLKPEVRQDIRRHLIASDIPHTHTHTTHTH